MLCVRQNTFLQFQTAKLPPFFRIKKFFNTFLSLSQRFRASESRNNRIKKNNIFANTKQISDYQ